MIRNLEHDGIKGTLPIRAKVKHSDQNNEAKIRQGKIVTLQVQKFFRRQDCTPSLEVLERTCLQNLLTKSS